jgi:hypothetical protein
MACYHRVAIRFASWIIAHYIESAGKLALAGKLENSNGCLKIVDLLLYLFSVTLRQEHRFSQPDHSQRVFPSSFAREGVLNLPALSIVQSRCSVRAQLRSNFAE